ncbi:MAG: hypothetical protein HY077_11210 [Elusimicrobia bacterium]|nr:hypothetical protein [Elusimicrobiota bacterium]
MDKTIALACLLLSSPLFASSTGPESLRAASSNAFSSLAVFKPKAVSSPAVPAKAVEKTPVKAAASQFVHVSGSVNLNGSGNVMHGSSFVWVDFSGYANVTDSTGRITSNSTWFNRSVGCNVSGGWVHCNDWPQWSVQFYKDGRYVGSGTVGGSISASAYAPNGFFSANSFTSLSGDVMVSEP